MSKKKLSREEYCKQRHYAYGLLACHKCPISCAVDGDNLNRLANIEHEYIADEDKPYVKTTANYTVTDRGERILWVLLEDDAQMMAQQKIGRRLTEDELYRVKKEIENGGMDGYDITLETAIMDAVEESGK